MLIVLDFFENIFISNNRALLHRLLLCQSWVDLMTCYDFQKQQRLHMYVFKPVISIKQGLISGHLQNVDNKKACLYKCSLSVM